MTKPAEFWSRRRLLKTAGTGLVAGGLGTSIFAPAIAKDLKGSGTVAVFDGGGSWGDAKRKAYFEPFEKETGIKVVPQPRGTAGVVRAGILAGAPKYDVANISGGMLQSFAAEGLLLPIDYGWWDAADRDAMKPVAALPHGVPALFYSLVLAYDASQFPGKKPDTWADLWDVKSFAGQRTLAPGNQGPGGGTFEAALLADGVAPEKLYPLDWDRAFKSLARLRPDVAKWWASGAESVQLLIDKQASAGSAWNGRVSSAQEQGAKISNSWNQGILQWDAWAVPKGAANVENAMKFIAFASRPEAQAKFAELILYGPTNARAFDHVSPARAALLPTAPKLRDGQIVQDYGWWNTADAAGTTNEKRAIVEWEKWLTGSR